MPYLIRDCMPMLPTSTLPVELHTGWRSWAAPVDHDLGHFLKVSAQQEERALWRQAFDDGGETCDV
eukprot:CAMPEP_0181463848 /NCGR_PEP_ID=MMETSP1110-20121109/35125_1 /TAXON_ID=174948 /ORGANISM="Symbiodinium sp., Strain CCMP421" /LENGTH=65 /DNA_ID=CAMNT_0023588557 /DNA_START=391 /DNA_END=589 /DNA_ORIENTATION=-